MIVRLDEWAWKNVRKWHTLICANGHAAQTGDKKHHAGDEHDRGVCRCGESYRVMICPKGCETLEVGQ